jgi:glycosyltransferase involved in cell wall biosynthesis
MKRGVLRGYLPDLDEYGLTVLHVDHSSAAGGAEFALLRMLEIERSWRARLLVPSGSENPLGVFSKVTASRSATVRAAGPRQDSGASRAGGGILALFAFAYRALGQVATIRFSREFRDADLIHANTSRAAVYSALACWFSRKRLVIHLRDIVTVESLGRIGFALFTRVALRRANGVIANSGATLASAAKFIAVPVIARAIPSAAGLDRASANARERGPVLTIGMVARIDPWKGQDLLLRAFATEFLNEPVRLVFAGSAPFGNEQFLADLYLLAEQLGVADQVDFLGHVGDVPKFIASCDICVQASLRPEPLGQNVLQYLAGMRATVAANAGGPAEWISNGENGLLFEMGNEQALGEALRRLSDDDVLRGALAQKALRTEGLLNDSEVAELHGNFFLEVAVRRNKTARSERSSL